MKTGATIRCEVILISELRSLTQSQLIHIAGKVSINGTVSSV
jgi:hypothetical protein